MIKRTMARTLAGASLAAIAAAGSAHAAALEQTVPVHDPPALPGRPLHRVRRHLHRPRPERRRRGAPARSRALPPRFLSGQHRRRLRVPLEHQRRLQGRPERPALLRADLRRAVLGRHPLRARHLPGVPPRCRTLYDGSMADLKTYQITGVLAYDVTPNVKVYGGLRAQLLEAKAAVSFVSNYSVDAENKWGYGYLLGAAYERPEIALRVALTYYSKISYDLSTAETIIPFAAGVPQSRRHQHRRRHARSRSRSTSRPASRRRRWSSARSAGSTGRSSRSARRSTSRRSRRLIGSRGRSSTTPTTGGPTTSASAGS